MKTLITLTVILFINNLGICQLTERFEKALQFQQNGEYEKAILIYSFIIESTPELKPDAYYGRAYAYYELNDYKNAKSDVKRSLKIKKNEEDYDLGQGNSYWLYSLIESMNGNTPKSLKLLKKASKYMESSLVYSTIGFKEIDLGRFTDAIESLNHSIELDSTNAFAYNNRALAFIKVNELDLAWTDVNKSIALNSNNPIAFKNRALVYISKKDLELACQDLQHAEQLGYSERMVKKGKDEIVILREKYCMNSVNK